VETPPQVGEAGGASVGGIRATTSPMIIDVDPISVVPGGAEDLVKDQPQIDLAAGGPGTSSAQVPPSLSSSHVESEHHAFRQELGQVSIFGRILL
jgi:hypothetical protein